MTIARHFNAGFNPQTFQVPQGRPAFSNETMAMTETMCRPVSRPCGTYADADNDPALKRRAIVGLSRWDERKRSVAVPGHSNARTATRFGQTDAGLLCHVAAPGDGRTPAAGGNCRCQNQFGMDERERWRLNCLHERFQIIAPEFRGRSRANSAKWTNGTIPKTREGWYIRLSVVKLAEV